MMTTTNLKERALKTLINNGEYKTALGYYFHNMRFFEKSDIWYHSVVDDNQIIRYLTIDGVDTEVGRVDISKVPPLETSEDIENFILRYNDRLLEEAV